MSASWYNVRSEYENNKLRISKDKGVNFVEITFPDGVYDYEDINDFIHEKIGKLGDDDYGINIIFDFQLIKFLLN